MPVGLLAILGLGVYLMMKRGGISMPSVFGPSTVYIPDTAVYGFDSSFNVQAFLEQKGSALANLTFIQVPNIIGTPASQIITNAARNGNVKPQYILAVLQREQGLIEGSRSTNPTAEQLDWAAGYGVPDTGARDVRFQGFIKQVNGAVSAANAAKNATGSYANVHSMIGTVVHTLDSDIIPATLASAMMLIYTPHSESLQLTHSIFSRNFPDLMA